MEEKDRRTMCPVIGFSGIPLLPAIPEAGPAPMPPEARGVYLGQGERSAFYLILDLMDLSVRDVRFCTDAVRRALPSVRNVHVVSVHNHGAVPGKLLLPGPLRGLVAECAGQAWRQAAPARMRQASGEVDGDLTMVRRIHVPEVDGSFTCFHGVPPDRAAGPFLGYALAELAQGRLAFTGDGEGSAKGGRTFAAGDPLLAAVQFVRADDGRTLGTIVRYAAHAVCENAPGRHSSDFPGHLRSFLEEKLGGTAVFLNGPCAEIAPVIRGKSSENARRLGCSLGSAALEMIRRLPFEPLDSFQDEFHGVRLPVRREVLEEIPPGNPGRGLSDDPRARKRQLEHSLLLDTLPFLKEKHRLGVRRPGRTAQVSLALLSLNQVRFLFFPGETFAATAAGIQAEFPSETLHTVTEHGRTAMYIPPEDQYRQGGYEPSCAMTTENGEDILRKSTIRWLRKALLPKASPP